MRPPLNFSVSFIFLSDRFIIRGGEARRVRDALTPQVTIIIWVLLYFPLVRNNSDVVKGIETTFYSPWFKVLLRSESSICEINFTANWNIFVTFRPFIELPSISMSGSSSSLLCPCLLSVSKSYSWSFLDMKVLDLFLLLPVLALADGVGLGEGGGSVDV